MRFRATVENVPTFFSESPTQNVQTDALIHHTEIIQSIEKLQKKCIIKFAETTMYIICNNDANEGGIQVWS